MRQNGAGVLFFKNTDIIIYGEVFGVLYVYDWGQKTVKLDRTLFWAQFNLLKIYLKSAFG